MQIKRRANLRARRVDLIITCFTSHLAAFLVLWSLKPRGTRAFSIWELSRADSQRKTIKSKSILTHRARPASSPTLSLSHFSFNSSHFGPQLYLNYQISNTFHGLIGPRVLKNAPRRSRWKFLINIWITTQVRYSS